MFKEGKISAPEKKDLKNEETILRILESGTQAELEQLRVFHSLTPERVKLFREFAQLRRKTLDKMKQELAERSRKKIKATQEELDMGCFVENIEPQVRETVVNLRRKGYATNQSGFHGFDSQMIGFEENHLDGVQMPQELVHELKSAGVVVKIGSGAVSFTCEKYVELDELEKIWKKIEGALPDLGHVAKPSALPAAESFREKQKK